MGTRKANKPEEVVDRTVGRVAEAAGSVTCDESLESEGRALRRMPHRETYRVLAQPDGGWIVEKGASGQVSSVYRTKDEAVQYARGRAGAHQPSQVIVYKQNGSVQAERTYG